MAGKNSQDVRMGLPDDRASASLAVQLNAKAVRLRCHLRRGAGQVGLVLLPRVAGVVGADLGVGTHRFAVAHCYHGCNLPFAWLECRSAVLRQGCGPA